MKELNFRILLHRIMPNRFSIVVFQPEFWGKKIKKIVYGYLNYFNLNI